MTERHGALPSQLIEEMIAAGYLMDAETVQPASIDLTLTEECYRLRGSYLPREGESLADIVKHGSLFRHDLSRPLEQNGIYLIRLKEHLKLPQGIRAAASNKSSSGRINLRGRLLADGVPRFDEVPAGYQGSLWIELVPKSFPVLLHPGDKINQLRFFHGDARLSPMEHRMAFDMHHLLRDQAGKPIPASSAHLGAGVTMTVDLTQHEIIGWKARPSSTTILDTHRFDHDPMAFFEPVHRPKNGELILHTEEFYILATKERILIPPEFSCEMAAYDASKGEFRSHFAGFFDPGFGWNGPESMGTVAVLEVEAYSHDFVLRDAQPICLMVYERMLTAPDRLYGAGLQSHYGEQAGPRLAKWFQS